LKTRAEEAHCLRWIHNDSFERLEKINRWLTVPVSVLSLVTGTMSFSFKLFPDEWQDSVPLIVGGIGMFVGVMSMITQKLQLSERMEGHRMAALSYTKIAATITEQLSLSIIDRNLGGLESVEFYRIEFDRLNEQSPKPVKESLKQFYEMIDRRKREGKPDIAIPPILDVRHVEIFDDSNLLKVVDRLMAPIHSRRQSISMAAGAVTSPRSHNSDSATVIERKLSDLPNDKARIATDRLTSDRSLRSLVGTASKMEPDFTTVNINMDEYSSELHSELLDRLASRKTQIGSSKLPSHSIDAITSSAAAALRPLSSDASAASVAPATSATSAATACASDAVQKMTSYGMSKIGMEDLFDSGRLPTVSTTMDLLKSHTPSDLKSSWKTMANFGSNLGSNLGSSLEPLRLSPKRKPMQPNATRSSSSRRESLLSSSDPKSILTVREIDAKPVDDLKATLTESIGMRLQSLPTSTASDDQKSPRRVATSASMLMSSMKSDFPSTGSDVSEKDRSKPATVSSEVTSESEHERIDDDDNDDGTETSDSSAERSQGDD